MGRCELNALRAWHFEMLGWELLSRSRVWFCSIHTSPRLFSSISTLGRKGRLQRSAGKGKQAPYNDTLGRDLIMSVSTDDGGRQPARNLWGSQAPHTELPAELRDRALRSPHCPSLVGGSPPSEDMHHWPKEGSVDMHHRGNYCSGCKST